MEINLSKFKNSEIFFIGFAVGFIPAWTRLNKFEDNMDCVDGDVLVLKKIIRKAKDILQERRGGDVGSAEFLDDLGDINEAVASKCFSNIDAAIKFLKKYDFADSVFNFGKRFAELYPVYLGLNVDMMDAPIPEGNFFKWHFDECNIPYVEKDEDTRFAENNLYDRRCITISNILLFTDKIMELLNEREVRKNLLVFSLKRKNDGSISLKHPICINVDNEKVTDISFMHFLRIACLCIATEKYCGIKVQSKGKPISTIKEDIDLSEVFKSKNAFSELNETIKIIRSVDENISLNTTKKNQSRNYTIYKAMGISVDGNAALKLYEEMPAQIKNAIPGSPISSLLNCRL